MIPAPKSGYPTSIRIPHEIRDFLIAEAARSDRSLSQLIAHILRQWVERNNK